MENKTTPSDMSYQRSDFYRELAGEPAGGPCDPLLRPSQWGWLCCEQTGQAER